MLFSVAGGCSFVSLNVVDPATAAALAEYVFELGDHSTSSYMLIANVAMNDLAHSAYLIYGPDSDMGATDGERFEEAMINAVAIVSFFLVATFVIVCCYKFNFNRVRR